MFSRQNPFSAPNSDDRARRLLFMDDGLWVDRSNQNHVISVATPLQTLLPPREIAIHAEIFQTKRGKLPSLKNYIEDTVAQLNDELPGVLFEPIGLEVGKNGARIFSPLLTSTQPSVDLWRLAQKVGHSFAEISSNARHELIFNVNLSANLGVSKPIQFREAHFLKMLRGLRKIAADSRDMTLEEINHNLRPERTQSKPHLGSNHFYNDKLISPEELKTTLRDFCNDDAKAQNEIGALLSYLFTQAFFDITPENLCTCYPFATAALAKSLGFFHHELPGWTKLPAPGTARFKRADFERCALASELRSLCVSAISYLDKVNTGTCSWSDSKKEAHYRGLKSVLDRGEVKAIDIDRKNMLDPSPLAIAKWIATNICTLLASDEEYHSFDNYRTVISEFSTETLGKGFKSVVPGQFAQADRAMEHVTRLNTLINVGNEHLDITDVELEVPSHL